MFPDRFEGVYEFTAPSTPGGTVIALPGAVTTLFVEATNNVKLRIEFNIVQTAACVGNVGEFQLNVTSITQVP